MRLVKLLLLVGLTALILAGATALCGAQQPTTYVPDLSNPILKGIKHWWKGIPGRAGGSTLYNIVQGSLNNATLTNMGFSATSGFSPTTRPGGGPVWQVNGDGTDDILETVDNAGLSPTTPFSVCLWTQCTASAGSVSSILLHLIATKRVGANVWPGPLIWFGYFNTAPIFQIANNDGSIGAKQTANANLALQTWYHLCFTYDGSQTVGGMAMYANGAVLPSTGSGSFPTVGWIDQPWRFLANQNIAPAGDYFPGAVESIMVFTRALPLVDVQGLYQASLQGDAGLFVSPVTVLAGPAGKAGNFLPFFGR